MAAASFRAYGYAEAVVSVKSVRTMVLDEVLSQELISGLQHAVLSWFADHGRDFPWRGTTNAFRILIAEVLLRQTQADRVVGPYLELVEWYPDAHALVQADVDELRGWFKPLGLVRRADRLVAVAKTLVEMHGGNVPRDLASVMRLPGLGIYSARAILCMSNGERLPMVDEASGRVLRRLLAVEPKGPAYSDATLLSIAESILPAEARNFNLGLIDIASTNCHPRTPTCGDCPLVNYCVAGTCLIEMVR